MSNIFAIRKAEKINMHIPNMATKVEVLEFKKRTKMLIKVILTASFFVMIVLILSDRDRIQKKYEVTYKGYSTSDFTPKVYTSVSTGKPSFIILYKGDKYFPFLVTRELKVSLEDRNNFKMFKGFLSNCTYDGLGNYSK